MRKLTYVLLACALSACSEDPVEYSAPVGINLKAKSGDVMGGVVSDEKGITTENGNPYGAFVSSATEKLEGVAPGRIEIDALTLTLGGMSTGVTSLAEIFAGDVTVQLVMNDTDNTYVAGTITDPAGVGPDEMDVSYDGAMVAPQDYTKMLTGSFKVVIRGPAAADFMGKGADADLQVTFTFTAFADSSQ